MFGQGNQLKTGELMNEIAIRVENLSKQYQIGNGSNDDPRFGYKSLRDTLTDAIASPLRRTKSLLQKKATVAVQRHETIWALKDVSFEVKRGEIVGIIGRNGAGKSTLLKILTRITEPSRGEATIYGRVGSLLEVGTGFHPELTGRENIYLNGAILGMKHVDITQKFDDIVDFAEIETFIDTPVKHYSSGMYMRLAFAIAAHLEPDILLVDEVLAVGDAQFQKKCLGKMGDAAQGGRTVLLVSHNMAAISGLCQRVLYIKDGKLWIDGNSQDAIRHYMTDVESSTKTLLVDRRDRKGEGHVRLTNIRWLDAQTLKPLAVVMSGQDVYLEIGYTTSNTRRKPIDNLSIIISFYTELDQYVVSLDSRALNEKLSSKGKAYCYIKRFPLMAGRFTAHCHIRVNGVSADFIKHVLTTDVGRGDFYGTGFTQPHKRNGMYVFHQWLNELPN